MSLFGDPVRCYCGECDRTFEVTVATDVLQCKRCLKKAYVLGSSVESLREHNFRCSLCRTKFGLAAAGYSVKTIICPLCQGKKQEDKENPRPS